MLMDMPPPSKEVQLKHAWNQDDCTYNIFVKEDKNIVEVVVLVPRVFKLHLYGVRGLVH